MKLAEALMLRGDYQVKIEKLKVRVLNNVKIQEGEEVIEDPKILLGELTNLISELTMLIQRINRTNSNTELYDGITISDALAKRDTIMLNRNILEAVVNSATIKQTRISRSEVKFISIVNVPETQKEIDKLSKEFRELDTKIQELNWNTELM